MLPRSRRLREQGARTPQPPTDDQPFRRARKFGLAILAASGLLTALTGFVVNSYFDRVADRGSDLVGAEPLHVALLRERGPVQDRFARWALDGQVPGAALKPGLMVDSVGAELEKAGAVAAGTTFIELALQNRRSETVTFTAVTAQVHKTGAPLDDVLVIPEAHGGETEGPAQLGFYLNDFDLSARKVNQQEILPDRFLDSSGLELAPGETMRFNLLGTASKTYVEWSVQFEFLLGGERRTMNVGSAHRPFRTTSFAKAYTNGYQWTTADGLVSVDLSDLCGADCRVGLHTTG